MLLEIGLEVKKNFDLQVTILSNKASKNVMHWQEHATTWI